MPSWKNQWSLRPHFVTHLSRLSPQRRIPQQVQLLQPEKKMKHRLVRFRIPLEQAPHQILVLTLLEVLVLQHQWHQQQWQHFHDGVPALRGIVR